MAPGHVFVDETKNAGYVLAAVSVLDPAPIRQVVRGLIVPGRRRIHMHNEPARRRRAIVSSLATAPITATIYDAGRRYRTDRAARSACLAALVADLAASGPSVRLVIEQDDSLVRFDRQELFRLVRQAGMTDQIIYSHQRAHEEPLLALPDVMAWCWVRSGDWRRRIEPIVATVRHLGP
jgi:hypothetical protein